jgi:Na+-transporting NADH:ubiquinone oxidoreductase subunit E
MYTNPYISLIVILVASMTTNNIVFSHYLGLCAIFGKSDRMKDALNLGILVTLVMVISSVINYLVYRYILTGIEIGQAGDLRFLTFFLFIGIIAAIVQLLEFIRNKKFPEFAVSLGKWFPLVTVNCAIMGVNLLMIDPARSYHLEQVFLFALGSGLGWLFAILLIGAIQGRLNFSRVPASLQGIGILALIIGTISLIFLGFSGMIEL